MEGIHYLGEMSRTTKLQIKAQNGKKLTIENKEAQNDKRRNT